MVELLTRKLPVDLEKQEMMHKSKSCVTTFAGAYSGGPNNEKFTKAMEQFGEENVMIVGSASTRFAGEDQKTQLPVKEYLLNHYYNELAEKAIEKFGDKEHFFIQCTSGGGEEGMRFALALLRNQDFKGKEIHFVFFGVPGFVEQGRYFARLLDFVGRFKNFFITERQLHQQTDYYPLPDEYYKLDPPLYPPQEFPRDKARGVDVVTAYEDSSTKREERRQKFFDKFFDNRGTKTLQELDKYNFRMEIAKRDAVIIEEIRKIQEHDTPETRVNLDRLVRARAKIVFDEGNKWYAINGKKWEEETPQEFLDKFRAPIIQAIYLCRIGHSVGVGMDKKLAELRKKTTEKNVKLDASFIVAGGDEIIKPQDVSSIVDRFTGAGVFDLLKLFAEVQALGHEHTDNSAEIMKETVSLVIQAIFEIQQRSMAALSPSE